MNHPEIPRLEFTPAHSTLVALFQERARQNPTATAFTYLREPHLQAQTISCAELDRQARSIARSLLASGAPGDRVLLLYPAGVEFVAALMGCLYASFIAVPAYPPRPNRSLQRLATIAADATARLALTTRSLGSKVRRAADGDPALSRLEWLFHDDCLASPDSPVDLPLPGAASLAYLQYTSGSTSAPKGVMVTHRNLLANLEDMRRGWQIDQDSVLLSWLPHFHDMGLIYGILEPLYLSLPGILMNPNDFLQRPIRWLQAMTKYRATHSVAPNFAYDLCVQKIGPQQRADLDLSAWRVAVNGAEPVRASTLEAFADAFADCGFRLEAFAPGYGLAESTLKATATRGDEEARILTVDAAALGQNRLQLAAEDADGTVRLVGCGDTAIDTQIRIVDPQTQTVCAGDGIGEIWLGGTTIARGYWGRPVETEQQFFAHTLPDGEGPFLRTGDLGFVHDGHLYVTGRKKDVIIVRGRNHYPQDIELSVAECHPALRPNSAAAFALESDDGEQLVLVQEVERSALRNLDNAAVAQAIREVVSIEHELQVHDVVLLLPGALPKTSSGKVQRSLCREYYLAGSLRRAVASSVNGTGGSADDRAASTGVKESHDGNPASRHSATQSDQLDRELKTSMVKLESPQTAASAPITPAGSEASAAESDRLINWLRGYAVQRIDSRLIDERRSIPPHVILDFGNQGILGMMLPRQLGGAGLYVRDMMRVLEQLAAIDITLAQFVGTNNCLGLRPIQRYASAALQSALLSDLASGRVLAGFAMTEPGAGSAVRHIQARAVADGRGSWLLSGTKYWSGNAAWAGAINVFAHLIDENGKPAGITGFVVKAGAPGLSYGPEAPTMGLRGSVQNTMYLRDVPVGPEDMLGGPGEGMLVAHDTMMFARLSIAAVCVGAMKRCLRLMLRYADRRSIATGPLLENPLSQERLSEHCAAVTTLEVYVDLVAGLLDSGVEIPDAVLAACKTSAPELLWRCVDDMMQMLGGRAYGENNPAPQMMRDARIFRIFEGPTESLLMHIGMEQLHDEASLRRLLAETLGAAPIADRLRDAVDRLQRQAATADGAQGNRAGAQRRLALQIGELATWAILAAAVEQRRMEADSAELHQAAEWLERRFSRCLAQTLSEGPSDGVLCSAEDLRRRIDAYAARIGKVESQAPGIDSELDPLLRPDDPGKKQAATVGADDDESKRYDPSGVAPDTKASMASDQSVVRSKEAEDSIAEIEGWLLQWLGHEMGLEERAIDRRRSMLRYGLDSMTGMRLTGDLEDWLGASLDQNTVWEHPAISDLAGHLVDQLQLSPPSEAGRAETNGDTETNGDAEKGIGSEDARSLLSSIDQLSNQDVDALLQKMLSSGRAEQ